MLTRVEDWAGPLLAHVRARRRTAFAYGTHDCALFAADGVLAMTGTDIAAPFRGGYSDEAGAAAALAAAGGDLEAVAAARMAALGVEEIAPAFAQRGDLLLLDSALGPALGLCVGAVGVFASPAGVALVALAGVRRAWRI